MTLHATLAEPVSISVAALAARVDVCELCTTAGEVLRAAVTVRHAHGGAVSMTACDRCASAMRRILAVAGGPAPSGPVYVNATAVQEVVVTAADGAPDLVGQPLLVHEYAEPFLGSDGITYVVRAWGQGRADGTWIGWLTFVGIDSPQVRKTPRETSQSSLEHLKYWATGLQSSYFEGAFHRAV